MKKLMSAILAFTTCASCVVATALALYRGDVNTDGSINMKDLLQARKYLAGDSNGDMAMTALDVDGDGNIGENDIRKLKRLIAGADEPQAIPEEEDIGVRVKLDSAESAGMLSGLNGVTAEYSPDKGALRLTVTDGSDPYAVLDLENENISADEYKYIVYTYMNPAGTTSSEGEMFFCAGDITGAAAGYSSKYVHLSDGEFHSKIFELAEADFWQGRVHSLRLDCFNGGAAAGDSHYVKSVTFCKTYADAARCVTDDRSGFNNVQFMFDYGLYDRGGMMMAYRMYVPADYDPAKEYPLLTFLHVAAHKGRDGMLHLTAGFPLLFDEADDPARDSIVFAPQCPENGDNKGWVDTDWTAGLFYLADTPESEPMKAAVSLIETMDSRYSTDKSRYYVTGASMGGYGVWDILTRHGELFAAGMPLCGSASRESSTTEILKDSSIWAFHGTADAVVPENLGSRRICTAIQRAGGTKLQYTRLTDYPHNIWDHVYGTREYAEWLLSQEK